MIIFGGVLFSVAFSLFVSLLCGEFIGFIDMPSFLAVIIPLVFFNLITKNGRVISGYIKSSFKANYVYDAVELNAIVLAAKNTKTFIIATGWFGFFAGIISMLMKLSSPEQLGPTLSVSLITVYYAIAIGYFIFYPLQVWAENKVLLIKHQN